ncbi:MULTISPECIES: hypothetical protein [Marinobacter]|uniref:hypothetical protein n=1 Tax=Marinobacter TaxID=2742 RepID=UPI0012486C67|nr:MULTISPECIES: hypothetical protein [Marinobacter]MBL3554875.1 hypothetical protein [Marinobacter sp. JB05H06]
MNNDFLQRDHRRFKMPLVVLPLLALLLVFLSSVTHQQASATHVGHGFIGPLGQMVVASHSESCRAPSSCQDEASAADGDLPEWWHDDSRVSLASFCGNDCTIGVFAEHSATTARFLNPLLRAPPLA